MRTEKGYFLPLTIITCFLFLSAFLFMVDEVWRGTLILQEKEGMVKLDSLQQMAVTNIPDMVDDSSINEGKEIVYPVGTARYRFQAVDETQMRIDVSLVTEEGRKQTIIILYDSLNQEIIKWIE